MTDVKNTSPNANGDGRFHFQKSFHEVYHAASYKRGGEKSED